MSPALLSLRRCSLAVDAATPASSASTLAGSARPSPRASSIRLRRSSASTAASFAMSASPFICLQDYRWDISVGDEVSRAHNRGMLPLLAVSLGYFMVILDATVVNVALPSVARDLGGGVSDLQWVVDGYTLVFAGLLLSAGSLGDRLGGRRVFEGGLWLFTIASAACAAAPSVPLLIAARLVQGVGAALLVPSSLALLRAAYP